MKLIQRFMSVGCTTASQVDFGIGVARCRPPRDPLLCSCYFRAGLPRTASRSASISRSSRSVVRRASLWIRDSSATCEPGVQALPQTPRSVAECLFVFLLLQAQRSQDSISLRRENARPDADAFHSSKGSNHGHVPCTRLAGAPPSFPWSRGLHSTT